MQAKISVTNLSKHPPAIDVNLHKMPLLVYTNDGCIALLTSHDTNTYYSSEADAVILRTTKSWSFKEGEFVKKLNLDNGWLIFDGVVSIQNWK